MFTGLSSAAAGTPQTITVEAEDQYSNTLTNFNGTVDFSSSDPQITGLTPTYEQLILHDNSLFRRKPFGRP